MEDVCRVCLKDEGELENVFSQKDGHLIADLVKTICPVPISSEDQITKMICEDCLEIIAAACELREQSVQSYRYLASQVEDITCDIVKDEPLEFDESEIIKYNPQILTPEPVIYDYETHNMPDDSDEEQELEEVTFDPFQDCKQGEQAKLTTRSGRPIKQKPVYRVPVSATSGSKQCKVCEKEFETLGKLYNHFKQYHDNIKLQYKCTRCRNQFKRRIELQMHEKIHEMDLNASTIFEEGKKSDGDRCCSQCFKKYKFIESLQHHYEKHHDLQQWPYLCEYCEIRKRDEASMIAHTISKHSDLAKNTDILLLRDPIAPKMMKGLQPKRVVFANPINGASYVKPATVVPIKIAKLKPKYIPDANKRGRGRPKKSSTETTVTEKRITFEATTITIKDEPIDEIVATE